MPGHGRCHGTRLGASGRRWRKCGAMNIAFEGGWALRSIYIEFGLSHVIDMHVSIPSRGIGMGILTSPGCGRGRRSCATTVQPRAFSLGLVFMSFPGFSTGRPGGWRFWLVHGHPSCGHGCSSNSPHIAGAEELGRKRGVSWQCMRLPGANWKEFHFTRTGRGVQAAAAIGRWKPE